MWFFDSMQEFGIEKTNKINKAAVKLMAMVEINRITKTLGIDRVEVFDNFKDSIDSVHGVVKAEFMKFDYSFPKINCLRMVIN